MARAVPGVLLVFCLCISSDAREPPPAAPLRDFLRSYAGLTTQEMHLVADGQPVAKTLKTQSNDEVAIFGIVKIRAPQELFIARFRDIIQFESGTAVHGAGLFGSPPALSDVADLQIDEEDLKEIPKCRPGNCEIKLSDEAMKQLREKIDWRSSRATAQAQAMIRQVFVDYVAQYQKKGDEALSVYYDKDKPQAIRTGLAVLLRNSSHFFQYDAQLAKYLQKYPQEKPPDTEDIFYWQKGAFGLKPVVRASHLVIHRIRHDTYDTYEIASKMLFASHYFRSALELKSLVPEPAGSGQEAFYLLCLNRSFVDGLTGIRGVFIRGTVKERSRQMLARYLASAQRQIEAAHRAH